MVVKHIILHRLTFAKEPHLCANQIKMSSFQSKSEDDPCVADETNHFSDSSESSTILMVSSPKHSTRELIQFWNTPHESGTTVSFTYIDRDSMDNANVNKSGIMTHESSNTLLSATEICSPGRDASADNEGKSESDILSCNGDSTSEGNNVQQSSPESASTRRYKAALLEVSLDEDRNDETETSMNCLDTSLLSHASHNNIEIDLCDMEDTIGKLSHRSFDVEVSSGEHLMGEHFLSSRSEKPALLSMNEESFTCIVISEELVEEQKVPEEAVHVLCEAEKQDASSMLAVPYIVDNVNSLGGETKLPNRLPPLAPSPRRSLRRVYDAHTAFREKSVSVPSVVQANTPSPTELSMSECSSNISNEEEVELHKPTLDVSAEGTTTIVPFSPESQVPADDDLDLTSIHSEDSDDCIPSSTRDHMIDVDSHCLLHDTSLLVPSPIVENRTAECCDENLDVESSREHNQSNDTEKMILNVMDAAGKAMQDDISQPQVQQDPSTFFDCDEFDTAYNHFEPAFPLNPRSPHKTNEEDSVERDTPLRSNSCRSDSVNGISNIVDVMASSKIPRRKLLPKENKRKGARKNDKKMKPKNRKLHVSADSIPFPSSPGVADDEDLQEASSVSTLEEESDKETDTSDLFWIDAFLDFVSPEDSRSLDSDSSTSTASDSHRAHLLNNSASVVTDLTSGGRKTLRQKKKAQTSLSRLRDWWQKELVHEVVKGHLINPSPDADADSFDQHIPYDSVEKIVSNEFHKVFSGRKVSLLEVLHDSNKSEKSTNSHDWFELFSAALESAKSGSLGCGVVETVTEAYGSPRNDAASSHMTAPTVGMSFDSLDGLVQKLKIVRDETGSNGLSGRFQSMYEQLQQKLEDANLFDRVSSHSQLRGTGPPTSNSNIVLKDIVENDTEMNRDAEVLPDDSIQSPIIPTSVPDANPVYSSPTPDCDSYSEGSPSKNVGNAPRFAFKSYARAKEAIAIRRKASALRNSEPDSESRTSISAGDVIKSSIPHQITRSDDPVKCDEVRKDFDVSCFQKEYTFSESQFKDTDDKNNITKETATDNSCTEDSLMISSTLADCVTSKIQEDDELGGSIHPERNRINFETSEFAMSENEIGDNSLLLLNNGIVNCKDNTCFFGSEQIGMSGIHSSFDIFDPDQPNYFRQDSVPAEVHLYDDAAGEENDIVELLPRAEDVPSTDLPSGEKPARTANYVGQRSLTLNRSNPSKVVNVFTASSRTTIKNTAKRHVGWLMSPASRPIMPSASRHKSDHMPFYDEEEKKEDNSISDPPDTSPSDVLDHRPRGNIDDKPFLSLFRHKARRRRQQKSRVKDIPVNQFDFPDGNLKNSGNKYTFSEQQVNSNEWEDFTSFGPFSAWNT